MNSSSTGSFYTDNLLVNYGSNTSSPLNFSTFIPPLQPHIQYEYCDCQELPGKKELVWLIGRLLLDDEDAKEEAKEVLRSRNIKQMMKEALKHA